MTDELKARFAIVEAQRAHFAWTVFLEDHNAGRFAYKREIIEMIRDYGVPAFVRHAVAYQLESKKRGRMSTLSRIARMQRAYNLAYEVAKQHAKGGSTERAEEEVAQRHDMPLWKLQDLLKQERKHFRATSRGDLSWPTLRSLRKRGVIKSK